MYTKKDYWIQILIAYMILWLFSDDSEVYYSDHKDTGHESLIWCVCHEVSHLEESAHKDTIQLTETTSRWDEVNDEDW